MKKILILLTCLLSSQFVQAQHVLRSSIVYDGQLNDVHYIFIKVDEKKVFSEWETYLSKFGRTSSDKKIITVTKLSNNNIHPNLDRMVSVVTEEDDFTNISLILQDKSGKSLNSKEINMTAMEDLFFNFYDMAYYDEELRMASKDLSYAESLRDLAAKDKGKAERNLEANLRAQEKLGKVLTNTPEELTKVLQEKDTIYQDMLTKEQEMDEKEKELAQKEMLNKEKELVKIQATKDKKASQLEKKEAEYEDLKDKLLQAKNDLEIAEQVVESKRVVLQELQKK